MFGAPTNPPFRRPRGGQPGFKWWILILVLVVGFPLLLLQTAIPLERPVAPVTPIATAGGESEPSPPRGPGGFLPEYRPDVIPALDEESTGAATGTVAEPYWLSMLDVVAKLALVLGLMYLLLVGLRWMQRGRRRPDETGGASIRLVETVGLAPGRAVHLISAGEKTLLVGATDYQLTLLAELPNLSPPVAEDETSAFETILQRETAPPLEAGAVNRADWRVAVERLRSGAVSMRQTLRKTDDAPEG